MEAAVFGEGGALVDPFAWVIKAIDKGGIYGIALIFAGLYIRESLKYQALVEKLETYLEKTINGLNNSANAMGDLRVYLGLERGKRDGQ